MVVVADCSQDELTALSCQKNFNSFNEYAHEFRYLLPLDSFTCENPLVNKYKHSNDDIHSMTKLMENCFNGNRSDIIPVHNRSDIMLETKEQIASDIKLDVNSKYIQNLVFSLFCLN